VTQKSKTEQRFELGQRVKKARIMAEMRIMELSAQIGVSRGTLSKIEDGASAPSIFTLLAIAEVTGRPFLWLIFGDDVPSKHTLIEEVQ
jgi:transcriptional regulator with XRE-family HTH domain